MKKVICGFLSFMMMLNSTCFAALGVSKEETVYVNLDYEGNVEEMNIYNKCITNGVEEIIDYTTFEEVSNLTNKTTYQKDEEKISWNTKDVSSFSYTGKIGEEYYAKLPWTFDVSYQLNGVDTNPENLLHQKGLVKITMQIKANENTSDYYKNNYMLEITGNYDMSKFLSVASPDAVIANAGNTKTLMFIVLPGQTTTLTIELGSEDFEMDGITMVMVRVSGNILDTVLRLSEEKQDMKDMLESIDTSTDIILNSVGKMNGGLSGISTGVNAIKSGTKEIHSLQGVRDEDLAQLKTNLEEVLPILERIETDIDHLEEHYTTLLAVDASMQTEMEKLNHEVEQLDQDLQEYEKKVKNLPTDVGELDTTITDLAKATDNLKSLLNSANQLDDFDADDVKDNLTQIGASTKKIAAVAQSIEDPELAGTLMLSAQSIGSSLTSVQKDLTQLEELSGNTISASNETNKNLKNLRNDLYDLSESLDKDGAKVLVSAYGDLLGVNSQLEKATDTLIQSNEKMIANSGDFYLATQDMKDAIETIKKADNTLTGMTNTMQQAFNTLSTQIYIGVDKVGDSVVSVNQQLNTITSQSNQFKTSKDKIKNIIQKEEDKLEEETTILNVDKEAKPESFGSEKNEVSSVQFLLKTKDIKEVKAKAKDMEQEAQPLTLKDRIFVVLQKILDFVKGIFSHENGCP